MRLQPVTAQNVVTYNTIISVDNSRLRLMPGMTATVSVIVRKAANALRIPTAALRFRPEGYEGAAGGRPRGGGGAGAAQGVGAAARGQGGGGAARGQGGPGGAGGADRVAAEVRAGATRGRRRPRPGLVFVLGPDGQPKATHVQARHLGRPLRRGASKAWTRAQPVITGIEEPGSQPTQAASPAASTNPFQPRPLPAAEPLSEPCPR